MTDFNIRVKVDPSGARAGMNQVRGELSATERQAQQLGNGISAAFTATAIIGTLRAIQQITDAFTSARSRLTTVTDSTSELIAVETELYNIAQRTASSRTATIELYARVANASRDLGRSQRETLQFTESLNQAIKLSGASTMEANSGIIQISQGLASGTLRGDELRSVLEGLPRVADVIADHLGVTRGELRAMGMEGRISAEMVFDAFAASRDLLAQEFGDAIFTVSDGFQVLRNSVEQTFGTVFFDAGQGVVDLLFGLAANMDTVMRVALALGGVLAVQLAGRGLTAVIAGVRALTVAIAANPLGALLTALTVGISLFIAFSDQMQYGADEAVMVGDVLSVVFDDFIGFLQDAIGWVASFFSGFAVNMEQINFEDLLMSAARFVDGTITFFQRLVAAGRVIFNRFGDLWAEAVANSANRVLGYVQDAINWIIRGINSLPGVDLQLINIPRFRTAAEGAAQAVLDAFNSVPEFNGAEDYVAGLAARAAVRAEERRRQRAGAGISDEAGENITTGAGGADGSGGGGRSFQDLLDDLERERVLLSLTNDEREIRADLFAAEDALKRELSLTESEQLEGLLRRNQALRQQDEILQDILGPQEDYERALAALNALLADGRISLDDYNRALEDQRRSYLQSQDTIASGVELFMLDMREQARVTGEDVYGFLQGAFDRVSSAIKDFVRTGRLDFKELFLGIVADFIESGIQEMIASLFSSIGGMSSGGGGIFATIASFFFENGGIMGPNGPLALTRYASGGIASSPQLAMFGEGSKPEAYVPLPDGRTIPVTMSGGGGGPTIVVNVDARGSNDPGQVEKMARKAVLEAAPAIIEAAREAASSDTTNLFTRRTL